MKLHGKDKLMILSKSEQTATHLPNVYRVIDNENSNYFVAKVFNPKTAMYSNRRFDKHDYAYAVERDPNWKPKTVRRYNAGV